MTDDKLLSVFTPSRTPPEDLEAIFVQRHALLDDAVERVKESTKGGNKHHLLFVGPRGTGKTHFVTLLVHRLSELEELDGKLRIAWLNEDETSTNLLELMQRIMLALIKRYPGDFSPDELEAIYDMDADRAELWLAEHLASSMDGQTLLIVTENLDALFTGLGKVGQQKLRAYIQEHPFVSIVATAQRLLPDLTSRKNTFFGFFQTEHLVTLSPAEAATLIGNIAELRQRAGVKAFLQSAAGRARIRALHHLAGGNHRIFIVLSQFITRENIDALVVPFSKMVDEMTPYYQERIRWLPAQQRKIVEFLCTRERPTPVKQIARRLFSSHQTISSQLKDLRDKGYVRAGQRGRESLYEIAEPLMRICVEAKENQNHAPLRILVDFLRVWYDREELNHRLEKCTQASLEHHYLQSAAKLSDGPENLRTQLLLEGYREQIGSDAPINWQTRFERYAETSETLAMAYAEWSSGNPKEAIALLDTLCDEDFSSDQRVDADALFLRAEIDLHSNNPNAVIKDLTRLIELNGVPVDLIAQALYNRGVTWRQQGDPEKEIADYTRVIELKDAPVNQIAKALYNRGVTWGQQGDPEKEIADYTRVIELKDAPVDLIAKALVNRGVTWGQQGDPEKEIADYTRVIELKDAPVDLIAKALHNRGVAWFLLGKQDAAQVDLTTAANRDAAPVETRVDAHIALAELAYQSGHWTQGLETIGRALALGQDASPPYTGDCADVLGALWSSWPGPSVSSRLTGELVDLFAENQKESVLGEALIKHLGNLRHDSKKPPAATDLTLTMNQWVDTWVAACQDKPAFAPAMRILRTGADFIIAGGDDLTVLAELNQEEREVLRQALDLEEA
jgi:tetratricopeptide (TPR) repeat protein